MFNLSKLTVVLSKLGEGGNQDSQTITIPLLLWALFISLAGCFIRKPGLPDLEMVNVGRKKAKARA